MSVHSTRLPCAALGAVDQPSAVVEPKAAGELRAAFLRRPSRIEPWAILAGACMAAVVVALDAPAAALSAFALTFVMFVAVAATLGRRSRWSALMPFTRTSLDVLHPLAAAVAVVGVVMGTTAMVQAHVAVLALAAVLAAGCAAIVRLAAPSVRWRIVVVGSSDCAERLRRALVEAGSARHEVVGFVSDGPASTRPPGEPARLGEIAALDDIIERHAIDMVLLEDVTSQAEVFDLLAATRVDLRVRVGELNQFYEDVFGHVRASEIDAAWFRYILDPRFRSPQTAAKRAMDVVVALGAGIVFLPAIGVCAVLIKLHNGGPVLFRRRRIGAHGREFTLVKLRTMRAEPAVGRWSSCDDDRVTSIGRRLRRMHLEELPQLLNVLRGEMSVVGPRPEQPEFVLRLEGALPHYSRRHLIKPGLSGWAQVHCGYAGSDAGSAWKLCHDLYYLKHQSLGLDLAILVETFRTLVCDRQFLAREAHAEVLRGGSTGEGHALLGRG